jgi:glycosyltransferase involved in cell wall biosynthesis
VVRRLCPDIVHAHYATSSGLAARIINVHPWLVTAHGTDVTLGVRSPVWRRILHRIFMDADCVNAVSADLRRMVLSVGTPPEKVETFTLGIDTEKFKYHQQPCWTAARPLRLICTRRFEPVYDHATILRCLPLLKAGGVPFKLTLVGGGSMRPQLDALVRELKLEAEVEFPGTIPNSQLPGWLARHDVYLSSSLRDGTSLCLLEAMAVGLYPIVSDITANSEWITHGKNGLLHGVSNPQSLADCIVSYTKCCSQSADVLSQNRQLVLKDGDRTRNMERLESIYLRLVRSRAQSLPSLASTVAN